MRWLKLSQDCEVRMFVMYVSYLFNQVRYMIPEFETLAAQYGDRVSFLILKQEDFPDFARGYGVHTMPHTIYFQNGTRVADFAGSNKEKFRDFIAKYASAT